MSERDLKAAIRIALGRRSDVRLFNNPVGEGWIGKAHRLTDGNVLLVRPSRVVYGLAPGSADLFGWKSVLITPDMVGQTIAQVVSPEVKFGRNKPRPEQITWRDAVNRAGGRAAVVRSVDEAIELVGVGR